MKKLKGRSVLGRGLDALIPSGPSEQAGTGFVEVDIERISPNTYQPRDHFDGDALAELADSIRQSGIIQPVVLRPYGSDYQLVAGERRWRAAQLAGLRRIPAVVKSVADDKLLELALVENIQRQDLSALETAKAFRLLIEEHRLTQDEVAVRVGMKRPTVANYLRLLTLAEPVRAALSAGKIEMGHARALSAMEVAEEQIALCDAVVRGSLSVRQAEHLVARHKSAVARSGKSGPPAKDVNVAAAERRLQRALGTPVHIVLNARGAGRIEIPFKSAAELDRLFALLASDQEVTSGASR